MAWCGHDELRRLVKKRKNWSLRLLGVDIVPAVIDSLTYPDLLLLLE